MHVESLAQKLLKEEGHVINTKDFRTKVKQLYLDDRFCVLSVQYWIKQDSGSLFSEYLFRNKLLVASSETERLQEIDERMEEYSFRRPWTPIKFTNILFGENIEEQPTIYYAVKVSGKPVMSLADWLFSDVYDEHVKALNFR